MADFVWTNCHTYRSSPNGPGGSRMAVKRFLAIGVAMLALAGCAAGPARESGAIAPAASAAAESADFVLRGGTIYDGSGGAPYRGDVAVRGDRIAYVGRSYDGRAARVIDASGLAVAPGFINMLSWATES